MLQCSLFTRHMSNSMKRITMITGDGASPYILNRLIDVFKAIKAPLEYDILDVNGKQALDPKNMQLVVDSIKKNKVALKGKWTTDVDKNNKACSPNMTLRKKLDLWSDVVKVTNYESISARNDFNIIVVRENIEGEYSSIEHEHKKDGIVEMFKVTTRKRCRQISEFAFNLALTEQRGTVHCIHKANIIKMGDGMFLDEATKVSKKYPDITYNQMIIDNCAMQLIKFPQQFNVILAPSLYGGIIINICSGLVGTNQILSGSNYSTGRELALFEPATRSSCDYGVDPNYANPMAMLHASCDMFNHMGLEDLARKISAAIKIVVINDISRTPDIKGSDTCECFIDAIINELLYHVY